MTTILRVGQRVRIQSGTHSGAEGYVRFVGRTEFKEGEWIGLELNEAAGKNNGSVGGVAYFRCPEKHGIFLKSGSAIEVLEEPKPATKPTSRPSIQSSRTPANGRPTTTSRPRASMAPPTSKRASITPSNASSASSSSVTKRLSTFSQNVAAPSRPSRLSTVGRSSSPKKPVVAAAATSTTSGPSTGRLSLAGPRTAVRSPSTGVTSPSPSVEQVLSPGSFKNESRSTVAPTATKSVPAQSSRPSMQQMKLVEELQTKVQFLEKKRLGDRDKLRRLPELEEKTARFETIIEKLQGKCQTLHQENGELKKQFKNNSDRLEELENMQAEHETIEENAILDRQLAEERAESFKAELDALQTRMEELELENEILVEENEELGKDMSPEEKASQGWVQLQRENIRLRDAVLKLRDWSQEQQDDLKEEIKLLEQDSQEMADIKTKYDDTKTRLLTIEAENEDLREQLDAAGNVETMIEQLTDRNHDQAVQAEELQKTVEHLEFVQQLNEELEVNHIEHEKQLQEIIDFKEQQVSDLSRRTGKQEEELTDREYTISRFRELVTTMQTDLEDMRSSKEISDIETQNLENSSRAIMDLNRQLQASASNVTVKTIDIELRQLETDQARDQLSIIQLFVPDAFRTEKDSIMSMLRFKRIGFKARLLHGFIKRRLSGSVVASNGVNIQAACNALDKLVWTSCMCDRFVATIESSPIDQFAKFESTFVELESVERLLNGYIENLKQDELQEQQVTDGLTRSTAIIKHLGEIHLSNSFEGFAEEALMRAQVLQSALENSSIVLSATRTEVLQLYQEGDGDDDEFTLFKRNSESTLSLLRTAKVVSGKLYHNLKDMKSRSLALDSETVPQFDKCDIVVSHVSNHFHVLCETVMKLISEDHSQSLSFNRVLFILRQASADYLNTENMHDLFYQPQKELSSLIDLLNDLTNMASDFTNLTEFEKPQPPWIIRSKELQSRKAISAVAEEEIKNLKRDAQDRATALKLRQQQLEEANMKIDLLEKRAKDAAVKLNRITELEALLKEGKEQQMSLEKTVETQVRAAQKAEEERDGWIRKASEVKAALKPGEGVVRTGAEMIRSSAEMEAMREELQTLQSMNRYLQQQVRQTQANQDATLNSWLSVPLRTLGKHKDPGVDMREALENIANLPFSSKLVRIRGKEKAGMSAKQTAKYQLMEQEIKRLTAFDSIESHWRGGPVIAGLDFLPEPLT